MVLTVNPATEETLQTYVPYSEQQVDAVLAEAQLAYCSWRSESVAHRAEMVSNIAHVLRANADTYAAQITAEMGKTITEARGEIEKCAGHAEYYASKAESFLKPQPIADAARQSYISYEPLGVILAIMPWNFPFWQVMRFAVPALLAGNTVVLKHASNVTGSALAIEDVFRKAGFPSGTFRVLVLNSSEVARVIEDPRVVAVTLTGSETAGKEVAAAAGRALKKVVLELGGSDPFIVLDDADIEAAAQFAARSRFQNAGQSCIAAKRFIVVDAVADRFIDAFIAAANAVVAGDPTAPGTRMGPLAREDLRENLIEQLEASKMQGARVVAGGFPLEGPGYFFAPTVVTDVTRDMPIFREETFGPLAAIIRVADVDDAIEVANDSPYGLSSNLWTKDIARAKQLAKRIESGGVFINGMTASSSPVPFGGIKHSGFGRELSVHGIREFTNVQTVWIEQE